MDNRKAFVANIVSAHGRRLRRYLAIRLKNATDVADLAQEVYLRLLRVERQDKIRNPEAYLFTIASHVIHQHTLSQATTPVAVDVMDPMVEPRIAADPDPGHQLDLQQQAWELHKLLGELPAAVQASVMLHCRDGWTLEEVAIRLGVSRSTVKKHLSRAVLHCRQRMEPDE